MEQKRFLSFIVLSMSILIGWNLLAPWLGLVNPRPAAQKQLADAANKADAAPEGADPKLAQAPGDDAGKDGTGKPDNHGENGEIAGTNEAKPEAEPGKPAEKTEEVIAAEKPPAIELPEFPEENVTLGADDPESGFRQLVTLTSRGAAVERIELNDARYRTLTRPHVPLPVVGSDDVVPYTLSMKVPQLKNADLTRLNRKIREVLPAEGPHTEATFELRIGELEVVKRYALSRVDPQSPRPEAAAYELAVELTFRNLATEARIVNYELQGPTGLPLENVENTQKFRDVVVGFVAAPGAAKHELMPGKTIAEGKTEEWQKEFDYIGVDVQYFAALLVPGVDQRENRYIRSAKQQVLGLNLKERSDVSVLLTSVDLDLEGAGASEGKDAITHSYKLFAGPKRDDLLPPGAEKVIDFGMFHWISRPMLALLKAFQALFGSWGLAVICLTIVVRSALFPLSIKQARGAAKMQELQPEIAALKEKYGKDKEKMARAQMELFSKHKYNPLAGCLPVFLQLPIFMGLYQALNHAVDLRMAKFLYIQNLAAPDAMFQLPFAVPFFDWREFNLLPLITIVLFIVQQKMFMPPPANEEQAMQQKMMNFMMIFMGVMFYKVPAGLCVYFIASSLWGMAERKLLPKAKPGGAAVAALPSPGSRGNGSPSSDRRRPGDEPSDDEGGGFFARLLKAAEKETSARKAPQGKRK
jgi:YidC/Oxa1 family membrane protein insertase